jgi:hypothetical protein
VQNELSTAPGQPGACDSTRQRDREAYHRGFRRDGIEQFGFSTVIGYDNYLSHCFRDAPIILGLKIEIEIMGYKVYVDWVDDAQLDRTKVS